MDGQMMREFVAFLQQRYGSPAPPVPSREPVTVRIPMFQSTPASAPEQFGLPSVLAGMRPQASGFGDMGMMTPQLPAPEGMPEQMPQGPGIIDPMPRLR